MKPTTTKRRTIASWLAAAVVLFVLLFSTSCTSMKKTISRHQQAIDSTGTSKRDSVAVRRKDSISVRRADSSITRTSERGLDTVMTIHGDTTALPLYLPDTPTGTVTDTLTYQTATKTIQVVNRGHGWVDVRIMDKPKEVVIHTKSRDTETRTYSATDSSASRMVDSVATATRDSTSYRVKTNSVDIEKTRHSPGLPWWVYLILLAGITACIYFGFNPVAWLLKKARHK